MKDHRPAGNSGIRVDDFAIFGTTSLDSGALSKIASELVGSCFNDDPEELEERIRALFQDRGYFAAEVKSLKIKPVDILDTPKPVNLEAEVSEGVRYRLAKIKFSGNRAFSSKLVLTQISLQKGDMFERHKIASSLERLRDLYTAAGYLTMYSVPQAFPASNRTMTLNVTITEGPQYHMGPLEVIARKDQRESLQATWQLSEGAIFDSSYIGKYIAENRSILPRGFNRESIQVVTDCPAAVVSVRLIVDPFDPKAQIPAKNVSCDSESERNE